MDKEFCKARTVKDIVLTSSFIIGGFILISMPTSDSWNILGFLMIIAAIILALTLKTGYKDNECGESYCKCEKYFDHHLKTDIEKAIEKEPSKIDLTAENKGNGIRLDIYYSKKNGKAYIQLFEYIPYKYEPCSKIHEHDVCKIKPIVGKL